jgi:hypothetical protein
LRVPEQLLTTTGLAVIVPLCALLSGCGLQLMPIDDPTPRSFVVPRLMKQCMAGFRTPPAVKLLVAGAEPRSEVRFVPRSDLEARIGMLSLDPDSDMRSFDLDVVWESQGARGQHCYQMVLRGAQDDPEMEQDHPIHGVLGIGAHGSITVATDALDDTSYRVERELFERVGFVQPLLPSEAIGVGARWRYHREGRFRGELLEIDVDYSLIDRQGSHLVVEADMVLRRPAQTVGGRKPGESLRLEALDRQSRAVLDVDLRERPFPALRLFDDAGHETEQIVTAYR